MAALLLFGVMSLISTLKIKKNNRRTNNNKTLLYYVTEPCYNEKSKSSQLWILVIEPTYSFNRALHSKKIAFIHKLVYSTYFIKKENLFLANEH